MSWGWTLGGSELLAPGSTGTGCFGGVVDVLVGLFSPEGAVTRGLVIGVIGLLGCTWAVKMLVFLGAREFGNGRAGLLGCAG